MIIDYLRKRLPADNLIGIAEMIVCKYLNSNGCKDIIKNKRLLAADPTTFNDPFEILPGIIGEPKREETLCEIKKVVSKANFAVKQAIPDFAAEFHSKHEDGIYGKIQQNLGPCLEDEIKEGLKKASQSLRIICFCNHLKIKNEGDDVLLWSHYGDSHKGVRIYFDTEKINIVSKSLLEVQYSCERPNIDIKDIGKISENSLNAYNKIFKTKNIYWKYEQEVRWIIHLDECQQDGKQWYIPLSPTAIRRIDLGWKCDSSKIISLLKKNADYNHVELFSAKPHKSNFSLEYEKKYNE